MITKETSTLEQVDDLMGLTWIVETTEIRNECSFCNGGGLIHYPTEEDQKAMDEWECGCNCPNCGSEPPKLESGRNPCPKCDGTGEKEGEFGIQIKRWPKVSIIELPHDMFATDAGG